MAVYTASKTAIEGFTASLALELDEFNVRVKLVEPGYGPTTSFASNGQTRMNGLIPEPYAAFAQRVMADFEQPELVTHPSDVAEAVWRAANDETGQPVSRQAPTPWLWRSSDKPQPPRARPPSA